MNLNDDFFRAAGNAFNLRIPEAKALSYRKSFVSSLDSEEALRFIESLDETRNITHSILLDKNDIDSLERALSSLDKYILLVFQLLDSVSKSETEVTLDCQLCFSWRGSLCQESEKRTECSDIIFEVLMSLMTKACIHHRIGALQVAADANRVPVGAQHMRICAGIMCRLESLIKIWIPTSNSMKRPQELHTSTCKSMTLYFMGMAQKMAVIKAVQKGGTTPSLLLKLSVEVSACMGEALKDFVPSSEYSTDFSASDFPVMIAFDRELFASLSLYFFALDAYAKEDIGVSIAFCRLALDKLNVQNGKKYNCFQPGLPPLNLKGRNHLLLGVENLKAVISFKLNSIEHDNKLVYFQAVPVSPNLPALPAGIKATEAIPFDRPESVKLIEFKYNPKRAPSQGLGGILGSIFEDWGSVQDRVPGNQKNKTIEGSIQIAGDAVEGGANTDNIAFGRGATLSEEVRNIDAACDTRDVQRINQDRTHTALSDEEFARRLQRQLDMGQGEV